MLTLLTPTRGRPQAFALCERWMSRQTRKPDAWVVATEDPRPYDFTKGQSVSISNRVDEGGPSFRNNLRLAVRAARSDTSILAFIDDDDFYNPGYLQTLVRAFDDPAVELAGFAPAMYFRVTDQLWRCVGNRDNCALGMSAIRASVVPRFLELLDRGRTDVDILLWKTLGLNKKILPCRPDKEGLLMHVGMKGMPGTPGIGIGHKPEFPGRPDPTGRHLRAMMGDDALAYREFMGKAVGT